ncbi:DUF3592 domain-containing protein [Kosakonia sp. LAM2021]|uniref:DUF3592 domain-containing protein n=1 Tax=Kosakonia sp. LAM2021 TaxID=2800475 RepID=UPI00190B3045|nr:DUF3592 domain-containing protein [Kosakonia sp. LAM2021]
MEFRWIYLVYLFIAIVAIRVLIMAGSMVIPGIRQTMMESDVRKNGVGVGATIVSRSRAGSFEGGLPVYRLTFKFKTREGVEVESSLERPLAAEDVMQFEPGNGVTLKYDPKDPKRIALSDRPLILGD